MRRKYSKGPYETAALTIYLVKLYDREHGRTTSRFRVSERTVRKISHRSTLRQAFLDDWVDELSLLGWSAFRFEGYFALIEHTNFKSWLKLGPMRIVEIERRLEADQLLAMDEIEREVTPQERVEELESE